MTEEFLDQMRKIQENLLDFIEKNENDLHQSLLFMQNVSKIFDSKDKLKALLYLILNIINYHHTTNFYDKIDNVLSIFKNDIKYFFSNNEIFNIFKSNKRIILFLIENQLLIVDDLIAKKIISYNNEYQQYFYPEIQKYLSKEGKYEFTNEFNEKRKIGENDDYICSLIRNDDVVKFISYTQQINLPLSTAKIPDSYFETNLFLISRQPKLIEYSAFFGSVQIFQYLFMNKVSLTPSLWLYAIHGKNPEIIHFLEEKKVLFNNECFQESIIGHHTDISNYLFDNYVHKDIKKLISLSLQSYNFNYVENQYIDQSILCDLCKFDHVFLVDSLIKSDRKLDANTISEAFIIAIENENIGIIKLLLTLEQLDINYVHLEKKGIRRTNEKTALHYAFENESYEIIQLLLSCPNINLNIPMIEKNDGGRERTNTYKTVLHIVIEKNNVEILQQLLSCQSLNTNIPYKIKCEYEPFEMREEEKTALELAIENGNEEIIKLLLECEKIDVNQKSSYLEVTPFNRIEINYSPFHKSIENANMQIIQLFVSCNRCDINQIYHEEDYSRGGIYDFDKEIEKTALHMAIENDNIELLKLLLSNEKLDLNVLYDGYYYSEPNLKTALQMAVEKENIEMLQLLLSSNNIDINKASIIKYKNEKEKVKYEKTALFTAIEKGNENIIKLLLSFNGVDINKATKYRKKILKNLENDDFEYYVERIIYDEISPLDIAVDLENLDIIQLLLNEKKINVNIRRKKEIIKMAPSENKIIKRILKEETILNAAIEKQNIKIIKFLISFDKLNIDMKSSYIIDDIKMKEITPLTLAIKRKNKEIIKLFEK
ncbi:hypothetical protein M9Y10_018497 [Tritrichomonas musculus]|uniref:DUF3447 domain-containing protein n=1 Tax=Tritrichomonas musculus TaxID=1915356 RepID=A0ABR2HPB6_9EUKA